MTLLSNRQPAPKLLFEHDLTQNRGPIGDRTIMKTVLLLVLSMVAAAREATAQDAQCVRERAAMVETIRAYARSDAGVLGQQGLSERVLEAMGQTKRHLFIPERSCSIAYADRPIPIGLGQTISQPFIVALMTQLAEVAPDHVVLEVGTGSGYQAAILARLARKVCTIEISRPWPRPPRKHSETSRMTM